MSEMLFPFVLPDHSPLSTAAALASVRHGTQLLRVGSRGEAVAIVQQALHGIAAQLPITTNRCRSLPDGIFGQETHAVVDGFQRATGLAPDGIVGPKTIAKLDQVCADCGLSSVITVSHALVHVAQQQPAFAHPVEVAASLTTLQNELRPFERDLWDDTRLSGELRRIEAEAAMVRIAPASTETYASAIPVPHPGILLLFAIGAVAIHVIGTSGPPPKLPELPRLPPPTTAIGGMTAAAIGMVIAQVKLKAREALEHVAAWQQTIAFYTNSPDPKCRRAVQKAIEAVNTLKLRAQAALNAVGTLVVKNYGAIGKDFTRVLSGLQAKWDEAAKAVLEMVQQCYVL